MLNCIADSFWFIVHLELYLELPFVGSSPNSEQSTVRSVANLKSVRDIWAFLWRGIKLARKERQHTDCRPQLRSLKVFEGSFRQVRNISNEQFKRERGEQAIFEARLSERDDLAERGHAEVVCLELEGLQEKYGKGPLANQFQIDLMDNMVSRAKEGLSQRIKIPLAMLDNQIPHLRPLRTTLLAMADEELC